MAKISNILTGATAGVMALGVVAGVAAPAFADISGTTSWQEVSVTTAEEMMFTGPDDDEYALTVTPSSPSDYTTGGPLVVHANGAWKIQWQAVTGHFDDTSTTAAGGTHLTASGFGANVANASVPYKGANTTAATANEWSAVLAVTGTNANLGFNALSTSAATVATGTATEDGTLTPTYSVTANATLTQGTYYGTIYYKLSGNV